MRYRSSKLIYLWNKQPIAVRSHFPKITYVLTNIIVRSRLVKLIYSSSIYFNVNHIVYCLEELYFNITY